MAEHASFTLEDYKIDKAVFSSYGFEKLIGMEWEKNILQGAYPLLKYLEDGNADIQNYVELCRDSNRQYNNFFLLSGARGNGKHSLMYAFFRGVYDKYDVALSNAWMDGTFDEILDEEPQVEDTLRFYMIPSKIFGKKKEWKLKIEQITEDIRGNIGENSDSIVLGFENLTDILKKKKSAIAFRELVECLLDRKFIYKDEETGEETTVYPLTTLIGIFHGDFEEIVDEVKDFFIPIQLDNPDKIERVEYFKKFTDQHKELNLETPIDEIAEQTDGFTFRMLSRLVQLILLQRHSQMINIDAFYSRTDEPQNIPNDFLEYCITCVRNSNQPQPRREKYANLSGGVMPTMFSPMQMQAPTETEKKDTSDDVDIKKKQEELLKDMDSLGKVLETTKEYGSTRLQYL